MPAGLWVVAPSMRTASSEEPAEELGAVLLILAGCLGDDLPISRAYQRGDVPFGTRRDGFEHRAQDLFHRVPAPGCGPVGLCTAAAASRRRYCLPVASATEVITSSVAGLCTSKVETSRRASSTADPQSGGHGGNQLCQVFGAHTSLPCTPSTRTPQFKVRRMSADITATAAWHSLTWSLLTSFASADSPRIRPVEPY